MRELTVRIRFTKQCLGNTHSRDQDDTRLYLPRDPLGRVTFMASWHKANLSLASTILNKHQDEVGKIHWDIAVDGRPQRGAWYKRYYMSPVSKKMRYVMHECFLPNQVVGINCLVPLAITDEDLWRLMSLAGQYKGISPCRPGEYGLFVVESIRPRRRMQEMGLGDAGGHVQAEPDQLPSDPARACGGG